MNPTVVSDILAVGEVPAPGQLEILAKAGFKSVINCQPDGEVDRFPGAEALDSDATGQGLRYAYAPIVSRTPSEPELALFQRALRTLPSPIYAFCYSGARAAAAAAFIETEVREPAAIIADFAEAGFDVSSLKPWLEDERLRHKAPTPGNGAKVNSVADNGTAAIGMAANGVIAKGIAATAGAVGPVAAVEPQAAPSAMPPAIAAARELQSIIVHARAAGASGFAVAG